MTYKVGPKGQVVLPKALRDQLGIQPGDEVDVELREEELVVRRASDAVTTLRGLLREARGATPLTDELEAERRADREREDRKYPWPAT